MMIFQVPSWSKYTFISFTKVVFFFSPLFLCDSHKVLLLLHKGDERDKIQTSISAVF